MNQSERSERTMNIKVAQVIGLNTDQKAAQVISSVREEEAVFAVLQLSCDDAFTKGRLALSELSDFYFESQGSSAEKLEATFVEAKKKLSSEGDFDLLLACISGKALYLIGWGQIEAHLKRLGKLSPLLSIGQPSQIISGFLQIGDRILLSTSSLVAFLGEDLEKSLDLPIDSFEEEISSQIAKPSEEGGPKQSSLAGLALEIDSEGEEVDIEPLPNQEQYEPAMQDAEPDFQKSAIIQNIVSKLGMFVGRAGSYFPKGGRGRLILALSLVVIIGAGVGLQYKSSRDKEKAAQFSQNLVSAKDEFTAAKGLSSLNPQEAKAKLDSAKQKVAQALSLNPKSQEAQDLQKQIENESGAILQESTASSFPEFLDLELIKKEFKAQILSLSAGKLLVLDPDTKTLVLIDIEKKSQDIISGKDDLGDAKYASLNGGLAFVYSLNKGLLRVDSTNKKITEVAKIDKEWGQITDIVGFASNVYLLDSVKNQVWKYLPTTEGYSDKREYLNEGVKTDFAGAIRMQIESSVYILKRGGEIMRFTRGDKDHFSLGGLDRGIKDPKSFFISSDTDNLYVLDSGNSRLLILTKTGEYKGQISGDKFGTSSDLVVDEKGKKVYLLEGSKIYSADLK